MIGKAVAFIVLGQRFEEAMVNGSLTRDVGFDRLRDDRVGAVVLPGPSYEDGRLSKALTSQG